MKIFGRWDVNVNVEDPGLKRYLNLEPIIVPRTGGKQAQHRFYKSTKVNIIERLMNRLQNPGHKGKKHKVTSKHCTGKGVKHYNILIKVFAILEKKLNKNPIEILIKAIENAAPRDEITTIEYGGARYPQAVECSPQRRIDYALRQIVQGTYAKSFNKKIKIEEALADELIKAYNLDQGSQAIAKKLEVERQASASR
jgi:small subunit ribosomal protein S7